VVQNGRFMGYTESGQSRANQGIPRFACNPDLNHARIPVGCRGGRAGTGRIGTEVGLGHHWIPRPNASLAWRRNGAGVPARF